MQESENKQITEEQVKSTTRTRLLSEKIFDAIKQSDEEIGEEEFTVGEVVDVLLRIAHKYNKHGLEVQYKNARS